MCYAVDKACRCFRVRTVPYKHEANFKPIQQNTFCTATSWFVICIEVMSDITYPISCVYSREMSGERVEGCIEFAETRIAMA